MVDRLFYITKNRATIERQSIDDRRLIFRRFQDVGRYSSDYRGDCRAIIVIAVTNVGRHLADHIFYAKSPNRPIIGRSSSDVRTISGKKMTISSRRAKLAGQVDYFPIGVSSGDVGWLQDNGRRSNDHRKSIERQNTFVDRLFSLKSTNHCNLL